MHRQSIIILFFTQRENTRNTYNNGYTKKGQLSRRDLCQSTLAGVKKELKYYNMLINNKINTPT